MHDFKEYSQVKQTKNSHFGYTFSFIFLLLSFYSFLNNNKFSLLFLIIFIFFLITTFFKSELLTIPNNLWMKFGRLLNVIFSPIILGSIFFFIILPTSFIMKCFRKDFLEKKYGKSYKTYWKQKDNFIDFNNQF